MAHNYRRVCCVAICVVAILATTVMGCTTYLIGRKATSDGSVMCSHTNDGSGTTDPRFVRVPAQDFAPNSLRPIWASPESYPRYVGYDRNVSEYYPENCLAGSAACKSFTPIGYIPQVEHTFAYFETTYGVMNERQVGIGESTCSGVFVARSVDAGGSALLSVDQLSQIAMERATTAREAVSLMGSLAEQYGFYGESTSFEGGSESLMVIDPTEGWVFHILADPTGKSAIWVAARVPDDSIAVVANMFSVRLVNLSDTDNFLGSTNMWEIAKAHNLWSEGQPMDFTATFSDGEYAHKYYSGRRMWSIFNNVAPSYALPSEYDNLKEDAPYPFTVKVDKPITVDGAFALLRDWYEGTNYSTSAGLAGGAFGTPDRFSNNAEDYSVSGNWERTIALFRTSDSFVVQARSWLPDNVGGVIWLGPHAAHYTTYVPITISVLQSPTALSAAYQGAYNEQTLFWASRNIASLAQGKFSFMIQDIRKLQGQLESEGQTLVNNIASKVEAGAITEQEVTNILTENVEKARTAYANLFKVLLFKYADGYINTWANNKFVSVSAGYPTWWLKAVGYEDGPAPVVLGNNNSLKVAESGASAIPISTIAVSSEDASSKLETCLQSCLAAATTRDAAGQLRKCTIGCL